MSATWYAVDRKGLQDDQRGDDDMSKIETQAKRWRAAQERADREKARLVGLVADAHDRGNSEYTLSDEAGVTRMTIRKWLGKP